MWEYTLQTLLRLKTYKTATMARSRYRILEADKPHFLTCTVLEWLPVFTRPDAVQILSWRYSTMCRCTLPLQAVV